MDFLNYSNVSPLFFLISFLMIGGIFSFIGSIGRGIWGGGSKDTKKATAKIDYQKIIDDQKADFEKEMTLQAQQSKKSIMMIALAGGGILLIVIMFMMMKK